jgi:site-specific recombinase XerD
VTPPPRLEASGAANFAAPVIRQCDKALRRLQRESPASPFVFVSERRSPFTTPGLARVIERAAVGAGLELKAHPHMLRHVCGYALAIFADPAKVFGVSGH